MAGRVYGLESVSQRVRVRTPGKHIVMFVAGAGLLVAAASVGVSVVDHGAEQSAETVTSAAAAQNTIALREFLVDLAPDRHGRTAYLRLNAIVSFRGEGSAAAALFNLRRAEVEERIAFLLRGLSREDFEGEEGMARVKSELLRRVNLVIAPESAADVLIADLVIQ